MDDDENLGTLDEWIADSGMNFTEMPSLAAMAALPLLESENYEDVTSLNLDLPFEGGYQSGNEGIEPNPTFDDEAITANVSSEQLEKCLSSSHSSVLSNVSDFSLHSSQISFEDDKDTPFMDSTENRNELETMDLEDVAPYIFHSACKKVDISTRCNEKNVFNDNNALLDHSMYTIQLLPFAKDAFYAYTPQDVNTNNAVFRSASKWMSTLPSRPKSLAKAFLKPDKFLANNDSIVHSLHSGQKVSARRRINTRGKKLRRETDSAVEAHDEFFPVKSEPRKEEVTPARRSGRTRRDIDFHALVYGSTRKKSEGDEY